MPNVVVIGASRGLGLEFARQYAADGWTVVATARDPDKAEGLRALPVTVERLDVDDPAGIAALAGKLAGTAIDLLVVNAGVYGKRNPNYDAIDVDDWMAVLRTNVVAPAQIAGALVERVAAAKGKVAFVSSRLGSMTLNNGGGFVYRSSKAALNAVVKTFAVDMAGKGVTALTLHPGWVKTDMGGPGADIDATTSVAGMRGVIAKAVAADTGRFFNYDGAALDW